MKKISTGIACFSLLALALPAADGVDPIVAKSPYAGEKVKSYSGGMIPWAKFKPNDFAEYPVAFSREGLRSVGSVPADGEHPRIFFSESDLPALRQRIKESRAAREAWLNVLAFSHALRLTYDENADYAKPDRTKGSFGLHARIVDLFRIGGYGKREDYFAKLRDGIEPDKKDWAFMNAAAIDALRCLVEDDAKGGQELAKAMVTEIKLRRKLRKNDRDFNRYWAMCLGLAYDFDWKFMTAEQREFIRQELVHTSAWEDNYGTFNGANGSRSNWATFSYWTFDLMALEGEKGFNDLKMRGLYRGWRNFMTVGYFKSGAIFEGEGKSLMGLDSVVSFDRAAAKYKMQPLSEHPIIRNHFGNFTALAILPNRKFFAAFDIIGGLESKLTTPEDLVIAHYLYPDDPKIDFAYRQLVQDDYSNLPCSMHHVARGAVVSAIFATDYKPESTAEKLDMPKTFFCGQRAMLMTRSGWDTDASLLTLHVRGASGGHPYRDRNGIMLFAKGRTWINIPWKDGEERGQLCNNVQIDGKSQNNSTPGRMVDFVDNEAATFAVGDAKYSWDWVWSVVDRNRAGGDLTKADVLAGNAQLPSGWKLVDNTFNDFAYTKDTAPLYNTPVKFNQHWLKIAGALSSVIKQKNTPVLKSFRTAGIVRGDYPYMLVLDDIQRDGFPTTYSWNASLPSDLSLVTLDLANVRKDDIFAARKEDVVDGKLKPGAPALLIRILQANGYAGKPELTAYPKDKLNLLTLNATSVAPDFKIMLYPFKGGEPIPAVTTEGRNVTVSLPGQKDRIQFKPALSGKTDLAITRNGRKIVEVNAPVPAFKDADSDRLTADILQLPAKVKAARAFDLEKKYQPLPLKFDPALLKEAGTTDFGMKAFRFDDKKGSGPIAVPALGKAKAATVMFWIKSDKMEGGRVGSIFNGDMGFAIVDIIQGRLRINFDGWKPSNNRAEFAEWTLIAITRDGQKINYYRDGSLLLSEKVKPNSRMRDRVVFGGDSYGVYKGCFADVKVFDKALTGQDIENYYLKAKYRN